MAFLRQRSRAIDRKSDELASKTLASMGRKRSVADKEWLRGGRRGHADFHRIGQPVGVLPDNDMALFQPQDALRLDAERLQSVRASGLRKRIPDELPARGRHVNFVSKLPDEANPQDSRRDAGDL